MHESDTYQAVIEEGELKHAKKTVLHLGKKRFGEPSEETKIALDGILDIERLDRMIDRVSEVSTWRELLETP